MGFVKLTPSFFKTGTKEQGEFWGWQAESFAELHPSSQSKGRRLQEHGL
jgi:hypothetical protein